MPAWYLNPIYAESVKIGGGRNVIDHISGFRSEKRLEGELLEMDKEEKMLSILEGCAQEHLVRQEAEEAGVHGTESGGEGSEEREDTVSEGAGLGIGTRQVLRSYIYGSR